MTDLCDFFSDVVPTLCLEVLEELGGGGGGGARLLARNPVLRAGLVADRG